jgi:hypothetical protein
VAPTLVRFGAVSFRTHLALAGFGLAGVYAAVGLVELIAVGDESSALVFAISAGVTAGLVAILLPLLAPRGGGDPGSDDDDGGPGGGGDGPPPPPWWPEFEREFWSHVDRSPARRRERPAPRERTPT